MKKNDRKKFGLNLKRHFNSKNKGFQLKCQSLQNDRIRHIYEKMTKNGVKIQISNQNMRGFLGKRTRKSLIFRLIVNL